MFECSKTYNNLPFAHRVANHAGHCRFVHGHSWSITFHFRGDNLDDNGFVLDLGNIKELKSTMKNFDHALVLCTNDPLLPHFKLLENEGESPFKLIESPHGASSESLAKWFHEMANRILKKKKLSAVCFRVDVREDQKNQGSFIQS